MEPILTTDNKLLPILNELIKREPIFHRPELGTDRSSLEKMTDPDFWEVGASGKLYSREDVINTVIERFKNPLYKDIWETKDFYCQEIAPNNFLLTYTLIQDRKRVTRRSTIWRYSGADWKILYHQGTIVKE
jgi:hypothetical protein